jgi:ribosomal protein S10
VGSNPTSSDERLTIVLIKIKLIMFFYLKVSSKNKKVLQNFVTFLSKLEESPIVLKYVSKRNTQKFITILKSPHVNKTAQEQFEFRFYRKQFLISSAQPLMFFLKLKKIKNSSFPGIHLEIQVFLNKSKHIKSLSKVLNPDNIILPRKLEKVPFVKPLLLKKYIQLFDCYGEVFLKNIFHLKSKMHL